MEVSDAFVNSCPGGLPSTVGRGYLCTGSISTGQTHSKAQVVVSSVSVTVVGFDGLESKDSSVFIYFIPSS